MRHGGPHPIVGTVWVGGRCERFCWGGRWARFSAMRTLPFLALALFLGCKSAPTIIPGPVPGAVAAPESYAKEAGEDVLRDGGNAVDSAVCMAFVLAVTHPEAGNLGGGSLIVVHTPK